MCECIPNRLNLKDGRNLEVRIIIPWMFDCCVRDSHCSGQRKINIAIPSTQPSNFNFRPMRPGEEKRIIFPLYTYRCMMHVLRLGVHILALP